ncbi:hypothetical protein EV668_2206 [Enterovirga rhinocerotis]|uniref:Cysteine rich repeat protein n=2 Tax=Enterovirga rhinocerotis TaxID=1339210 RepID=A0A4R7CBT5_9HYPH|nr:hypothetical protein EV668_2206 [Enterovirga rhinocerotis]
MLRLAPRSVAFALSAAILVAGSGAAVAASEQEMAEYRRDCTMDYTRLCSAYDPGSPQVRQCFAARRAELSPRCAATIAKYETPEKPQRRR